MQGQLAEIDVRSILQLIELGQRTGELYVESYPSPAAPSDSEGYLADRFAPQSWLVFLLNGQIVYAGTTDGRLDRLRGYLHRYGLSHVLDTMNVPTIATFNSPEYGHLWALLENHILSPRQGRTILSGMVQETLFDLLSLHQGSFVFQLSAGLSPQLTTFDITSLMATLTKQIQAWKHFYPHVQSPHQAPMATSEFSEQHQGKNSRLLKWLDGHTSMRQIARYLNRDIVTVAKAIYPHVRQGTLQLLPPEHEPLKLESSEAWDAARVPRVVCVDDGITIRETVEHILDEHGYEVTSIANPLRALSLLFQLKPDFILCDIAMPELEGYQLCAMLRQSTVFRQLPIVMLTGRDGFIDRVKARMAGATDYLTKPFGTQELLTLVEKYVGPGNPTRPNPDSLLQEAIEDDLELETGPLPPLP